MTEKEEKNDIVNQIDETVNFIPLIIFEKYLEIIDNGMEFLNNFNNKVIILKIILDFIKIYR